MGNGNILDRPANSPVPAAAGANRADGNPDTNARGMYLATRAANLAKKIKTARAALVAARAALAAEGAGATADVADDWNPTGWVIDAGLGILALHSYYQLQQAQKALANAQKEQEQAQAGGGSTTNVNTPGKDPCDLQPYNKNDCPGGKKHHVLADYVLRYGTRGSDTRIPNAPSLNEGLTICLSQDEHTKVHALMDKAVAQLGGSAGTAPISEIVDEAIKALEKVKPECEGKLDAVRDQFEHMGDQHGRTTKSLPGSEAKGTLQSSGAGAAHE